MPTAAPPPQMIHVHVDRETQSNVGGVFTTGAWPQGNWWESFGAKDLDALVAQALAENPDLAAAQARIAAAEAAVEDARSRLRPHLGAGAKLEEEHFSATGEHSLLNGRSVLFGDLEPLRAVYDPDISGENARRLAAAIGEVRVKRAQRAAARLQISTAVARTWFAVAGLDGALVAESRRLTLAKRFVAVQKARLRAGLADADGLYAGRRALAELRREVELQKGERRALLAGLAALVGGSPQATAALRPLPPALRRFPVPTDLPIGLLRHRPDVMAALWRVESARQEVHAARAAFFPRLNLALFAGWNSIHVEDLFNPSNLARGIGLSLSLPLFEGGALRAGLKGAQARYALAVDRYNARVLAAVKEVAGGLALWKANRRALQRSRSGVSAARARLRVRQAAFRAGLSNVLPSVTAEIAKSEEEEKEAQQRALAAQSWVNLVAALGGGYEDRLTDASGSSARAQARPGSPAAKRDFAQGRRATKTPDPPLQ